MRATPDSSNSPPSSASAAVKGRMAVPALPMKSDALVWTSRPPSPPITAVFPFCCTVQPSRSSAVSMTAVSSDASRSCTVVCPRLSAASSRTRLEMLLEPGRRTVPPALASGGISRDSISNMGQGLFLGGFRGDAPVGARFAGLLNLGFQCVTAAAGNQLLQRAQGLLENFGLRQQFFTVGNQDVAPHGGVAGGDA